MIHIPDNTDVGDIGCWWLWDAGNIVNGASDPFIQPLITSGIMAKTPIENDTAFQCNYRYAKQDVIVCGPCTTKYAVLYTLLETDSIPAAKGDERPDCLKTCWGEGSLATDYAIYMPY